MAKISYVGPYICEFQAKQLRHAINGNWRTEENHGDWLCNRRGAPGGKLKMTLGLPVYVTDSRRFLPWNQLERRIRVQDILNIRMLANSSGTAVPSWTAATTAEPEISILFQSRVLVRVSTVCQLVVLVIWLWPQSRRESLSSERRSCQQLSSDKASHGSERTVFSCTSKITQVWWVNILFAWKDWRQAFTFWISPASWSGYAGSWNESKQFGAHKCWQDFAIDCQPQGWDEGICYYWTSRKGGCWALASAYHPLTSEGFD